MFDLNMIEQDYLKNSFRLKEKEIIEIYQAENATLSAYEKDLENYRKKTGNTYYETAEQRLLIAIFEHEKRNEYVQQHQKLIDEIPKPQKRHLSKEAQKKVIEGCLFIVFNSTREWYNFFRGKISMENLYYICLESLFNSVKYMTHCEKPVFELYVLKSIEQSIIKYISRINHISYRQSYDIVTSIQNIDTFTFEKEMDTIFSNFGIKEEIEKTTKIFYRLKEKEIYYDYLKNISSIEFLSEYKKALSELNNDEEIVMQLSYDINGYKGLTYAEIGDYLGYSIKEVSNIKRNAIKKLRRNINLKRYNI